MNGHWGIRLCAAVGVAAAVFATGVTAPPAGAVPGEAGVLADAPTVPVSDMGIDGGLTLYGLQGTGTLTVPVPDGLVAATLNVTAQLPVNVESGTITVSQGDRLLARQEIPPGPPAPVVIPLTGVTVEEHASALVVRSYLVPREGQCLDPTNPLRLTDITVSYGGVEQRPGAVADFLPPILRKLTIFVGAEPSHVEIDAVVRVATAVVARYGKQPVRVVVEPLPADRPPGPQGPFEREIAIVEGPSTGVTLQGDGPVPALLVSGPAGELTNQSRLLTSGMARFAVTSKAIVGTLNPAPRIASDVMPIRELGQPGVNATALNPQVGVAVDQARFGRAIHNVRVHLLGGYTPIPESVGGQLVVSVAGEVLARWPAEPSGEINRWVDIPDRLLRRYTTLDVGLPIAGNTGRCGEFQPITLTIDGATAISTEPASPPVPAGFQALPQALMPRVEIGITDDVFADTARAVEIMTGLQTLSTLPIDTKVVPIDEALRSSAPAILISAGGWDHPDIPLPITAPRAVPTTIDVLGVDGQPDTTEIEPGLEFGSLQTAFQNGRQLLVATSNGSADQLDALVAYLQNTPRLWAALDGAAVIQVAGRAPIVVPTPAAPAGRATQESSGGSLYWAAATTAGVLVAALAAVLVRRRRSGVGET